jgi:hypothetical protein
MSGRVTSGTRESRLPTDCMATVTGTLYCLAHESRLPTDCMATVTGTLYRLAG